MYERDGKRVCWEVSVCVGGRATERTVGAQGKYKKWGLYCVRGIWGHTPKDFTCSEVYSESCSGSFLRMHTVHTYLPVTVFV